MSSELVQFNSGDHLLGDKNIIEALKTDGDIVFNESYIVVGPSLEAKLIHATYNLTVMGNICAEKVFINGSLLIQGNIDADSLVCRGSFICTGEARIKELELGNYSIIESVVSDELRSSGDLFVHSTVDTNCFLEIDGLVVAGEGILGKGVFQSKAAIANDYFEFNGETRTSVFEISTMKFSSPVMAAPTSAHNSSSVMPEPKDDMEGSITNFVDTFASSIKEWSKFEEERFIKLIRTVISKMPDLHATEKLIDKVVELTYEKEIANFRDYLIVLSAKNIFTKELTQYETFEPVLTGMFDDATPKVKSMEFKSTSIFDFAESLFILSIYHSQLPISLKDGADKIFSSIGLRYSTVEHAWRVYNE